MRESNPPQDTHEHLRHPAGHIAIVLTYDGMGTWVYRHASFNLLYTALIQRRALASCGVFFALLLRCGRSIRNPNRVGVDLLGAQSTEHANIL